MKKGVDFALFRVSRRDNRTGEVTEIGTRWARPPHGVKALRRRYLANKRAKQARKLQRGRR